MILMKYFDKISRGSALQKWVSSPKVHLLYLQKNNKFYTCHNYELIMLSRLYQISINISCFFFLDGQTIVSPVIVCGPNVPGILMKPIILSFHHCASMRQGGWMLSLYNSDTQPEEAPCWQVGDTALWAQCLLISVLSSIFCHRKCPW